MTGVKEQKKNINNHIIRAKSVHQSQNSDSNRVNESIQINEAIRKSNSNPKDSANTLVAFLPSSPQKHKIPVVLPPVTVSNPSVGEISNSPQAKMRLEQRVIAALDIIKSRLQEQRIHDLGGYKYSLEYATTKKNFLAALNELKAVAGTNNLDWLKRGSIIAEAGVSEKTNRSDYGRSFLDQLEKVAKQSPAAAAAVEKFLKNIKIETYKSYISFGIGGNDLITGQEVFEQATYRMLLKQIAEERPEDKLLQDLSAANPVKSVYQKFREDVFEKAGSHFRFYSDEERAMTLEQLRNKYSVLEFFDAKALEALQASVEPTSSSTQQILLSPEALAEALRTTRERDIRRLTYINQGRSQLISDAWEKQGWLGGLAEKLKTEGNLILSDAAMYILTNGSANAKDYRDASWFKTLPLSAQTLLEEQVRVQQSITELAKAAPSLSDAEFNARYKAIRGEDVLFDRYLEMDGILNRDTHKYARLSEEFSQSNKYLDSYVCSQEMWASSIKFVGTMTAAIAITATGQVYLLPSLGVTGGTVAGGTIVFGATAGVSGAAGLAIDLTDAAVQGGGVAGNFDLSKSIADNAVEGLANATFFKVANGVSVLCNTKWLASQGPEMLAVTLSKANFSPEIQQSIVRQLSTRGIGGLSTASAFASSNLVSQVGSDVRYGTGVNFNEVGRSFLTGGAVGVLGSLGNVVLVSESGIAASEGQKGDALAQTATLLVMLHVGGKLVQVQVKKNIASKISAAVADGNLDAAVINAAKGYGILSKQENTESFYKGVSQSIEKGNLENVAKLLQSAKNKKLELNLDNPQVNDAVVRKLAQLCSENKVKEAREFADFIKANNFGIKVEVIETPLKAIGNDIVSSVASHQTSDNYHIEQALPNIKAEKRGNNKHPIHLKDPKLHNSAPVKKAVKSKKLVTGKNVPNEPGPKIDTYINRLENIFLDRKTFRKVYRDKIYDQLLLKPENYPESEIELQKKIAREQGHGTIEITPETRKRMIETVINDQKKSLDNIIDYLASSDAVYPAWFKFYAWNQLISLSQFDKKQGKFKKRTKNTVAPFPDINREALAQIYDIYEGIAKGNKNPQAIIDFEKNFPKLYAELIQKSLAAQENNLSIEGEWRKFSQGNMSHAKELWKSLQGRGTGWCTAGQSTANTQIQGGDFYVYYSKDEQGKFVQPRLAIRMNKNKIGEIRGILPSQNIEPVMQETLNKKLAEFGREADVFRKRSADMQRLTDIDNRAKTGEELTVEDLRFLYEIDGRIEGFGYSNDPRIKELLENRNKKQDLSQIFNCKPEEVRLDEDINEQKFTVKSFNKIFKGAKIYYGHIDLRNLTSAKGIKLPEYVSGNLFLDDLTSAKGLQLPKHVGGGLNLNNLTSAEGLQLPEYVGGYLDLTSLTSAEGLQLPKHFGGILYLGNLTSAKGLQLPKHVSGALYLDNLTSAEGLQLPKHVDGDLFLSRLTSAKGIKLPEYVSKNLVLSNLTSAEGLQLTEYVGGDLYLDYLTSAEGLQLPKHVGGNLYLRNLTSVKGLQLPEYVGKDIYLNKLTSAKGLQLPEYVGGHIHHIPTGTGLLYFLYFQCIKYYNILNLFVIFLDI
ncbi:MAG: hypothetical protein LBE20_02030 [Deltaproteobacteria bacterium]|jgi:hypothetical protein|nr:hypothetical protein [Deltaproteobacteria bacterium]